MHHCQLHGLQHEIGTAAYISQAVRPGRLHGSTPCKTCWTSWLISAGVVCPAQRPTVVTGWPACGLGGLKMLRTNSYAGAAYPRTADTLTTGTWRPARPAGRARQSLCTPSCTSSIPPFTGLSTGNTLHGSHRRNHDPQGHLCPTTVQGLRPQTRWCCIHTTAPPRKKVLGDSSPVATAAAKGAIAAVVASAAGAACELRFSITRLE